MEQLLRNIEYWDKAFTKLSCKKTLSVNEKVQLTRAYTFNRDEIVSKILSGQYEWSIPRRADLRKSGTSKKRVVYIYEIQDRLVLGVLYYVLSEYFKDRISQYCYSYKTGCNTGKAIKFIRDYKPNDKQYGVKVDIHAYFNNISRTRITEMLDELFTEEYQGLKTTLEKLMYDDRCIYHEEIIHEYKGVIPGTPIASFFANYCLRECDNYFENTDAVYARYSDDIIVLNENKEEMNRCIEIIKGYISKYGLELNPDKYKYFNPGDDIVFLGLKLKADGNIDMSDHAKQKVKRTIHRWCKKGRKEMELGGVPFMKEATKINNRLNNKNFKCYIKNEGTYGWCHYMFRYITTDESLKEIDLYTKDTLRAMRTGKHNKANYKAITEDEFNEMKWVSLVQLYHLYRKDFDYYCEIISLL